MEGIVAWAMSEQGSDEAEALYQRIENCIDTLRSMPNRGRIVAELREVGVTAYREIVSAPYRIVFRVAGGDIILLGVLDHRRDLQELLLERAIEDDG